MLLESSFSTHVVAVGFLLPPSACSPSKLHRRDANHRADCADVFVMHALLCRPTLLFHVTSPSLCMPPTLPRAIAVIVHASTLFNAPLPLSCTPLLLKCAVAFVARPSTIFNVPSPSLCAPQQQQCAVAIFARPSTLFNAPSLSSCAPLLPLKKPNLN